MITSIELGDFLSHSSTNLEFENGVTVFVGSNGGGKSSIIDAITFALFGRHTRKSNKGLIKRGSNQGYAKARFAVNNRQYEAVRKIDSKGALSAKFSEVTAENGPIEIAAGERKQFGESMTEEIEKVIGLDFEKLKIASIVQQGELNSIINAKPKEFKELLNAIIGIDKLDIASENMKTSNKEFRKDIRERIGYDDTHIEILLRDLEDHEMRIKNAIPEKNQLEESQKKIQSEMTELRERIEIESPKIGKSNQLEARKKELLEYAKSAIVEIKQEIDENEHKIRECKGCFEFANLKVDFESKIQMTERAIDDTQNKIQELTMKVASLKEKQILAAKLQLKDKKCPVCDSVVEKLNPLFQEEHLKQEVLTLEQQIKSKEDEKKIYSQKRREFLEKLQKSKSAEATLRAYSVNNEDELKKMQEIVEVKKKNIQRIPAATNENLLEIAHIDTHTRAIFDNILELEDEVSGFNEKEYIELKKILNQKQNELSQIDQRIGAISEIISTGNDKIEEIQKNVSELTVVKEYMKNLEEVQTKVFSRDGPVATSLRSWALSTISAKASEYLMLLNTKIQRILLAEKTRDIAITCFAKNEVLDLESLSGGEKVSVALALRLGMANLLGASNLNMMILDEPTTHLDAERKKSLVGVLSQLSNISNSEIPMQFLIITHDAEIFEDSTVEKIYKFESSENGSKVIAI